MLGSTLEPLRGRRDPRTWRVPSLTVLFHSGEPDRAGQVARLVELLEGKTCNLSRLEPSFSRAGETSGRPLADRYLSRTPAAFVPEGDGVQIDSAGSALRADGKPLPPRRTFSRAELESGVVIEMADRVVLLLHLLGPPLPRQPQLGMVGDSESMERVREEVRHLAGLAAPVLVSGESGTGKELVAHALAATGVRANGPFVAVNMAAIPPSTAASELFGHRAGAFTGAARQRSGFFAQANGGTLFLDEIATAGLDVQAMLLRALETGETQPLGRESSERVDVRIVAATDEDLHKAMREGRFREALYHRLSACEIKVPPLRERRDDLGQLLLHFVRSESKSDDVKWIPASLIAQLARHDWPGNVRELVNVARRLVVAKRAGRSVEEGILAPEVPGDAGSDDPPGPSPQAAVEIGEGALQSALKANRWKIGAAARALGISRTRLYSLIEASDAIRKAKDVPEQELRAAHQACGGDVEAMAEQLQVSSRGIRLKLKELGLS